MLRKPGRPTPVIVDELEDLLDTYDWVRVAVYRRNKVPKAAVALLRYAVFNSPCPMAKFRNETQLPKPTVTRAARFLSEQRPSWAELRQQGRIMNVFATAEGVAKLKDLNRQLKRTLFARLRIRSRSNDEKLFANALRRLTEMFPQHAPGALRLLSASRFSAPKW